MLRINLVKTSLLFGLLTLSACATSTRSPEQASDALPMFNARLFERSSVIQEAEITRLNQAQREAFLEFLNDPKFALTPKHVRVATYLGLLLDQFEYSDKTYTAQQSLIKKAGNCLSLTVLTTALAKLADVDVHYQLLVQNPVYDIDENLLVTSDHLRAVLITKPEYNQSGFSTMSGIRIDYFQTDGLNYIDNVSTDTQLSMFYSNLGVEYLLKSKLDESFWYARNALKLDSKNASALNTIAILHRKKGDDATAEKIYQHGARHFAKGPTFVRNYAALLESQSRDTSLDLLLSRLPSNAHDHPWHWISAGRDAYREGEYNQAVVFYQRAIALAPDLHQVYLFAGKASYAAGDKKRSQKFIQQALAVADSNNDRQHYKRKLNALHGQRR